MATTTPEPPKTAAQAEDQNAANILAKLQDGKVLAQSELEIIKNHLEARPSGNNGTIVVPLDNMTAKQRRFAELIASGLTGSDAYRQAYGNTRIKPIHAARKAFSLTTHPKVMAYVAQLRMASRKKVLLSIDDRYAILADIAMDPTTRKADKIRSVEVYSKISGDQAPERHEHSGPGGTPIQTETTATTVVRRMTPQERIADMKARRVRLKAQDQAASEAVAAPIPDPASPVPAPA